MNSILIAVLGGAAGLAIGAGLGLLAARFKGGKTGVRVGAVLGLILAAAGAFGADKAFKPTLEGTLAKQSRVYHVLKEHYPAEFAHLADIARTDPRGMAAVKSRTGPVVDRLIKTNKAKLDAASSRRLAQIAVTRSEALLDRDATSCVALLFNGMSAVDLDTVLPPQVRQKQEADNAAVLDQLAMHPAPAPGRLTNEERSRLIKSTLAQLTPEEGETAVRIISNGALPQNDGEARAVCRFNIVMYKLVVDLPDEAARGVLAMG